MAERMRPRSLEEVYGQEHIVGPGRLLWRAIKADKLSSLLLYGPPGTGKTSLAHVIAHSTKGSFESLNAVLGGVKDIREAIARAKERKNLYGKKTILFVDEVHRWNKAQQDALLPWVENGSIILIGATTENPYFEVNPALVSRSRVFQLLPLNREDLSLAAVRAIQDTERGYGKFKIDFETGALEHLINIANGDVRSLLNALELAVETSVDIWPPKEGQVIYIDLQTAEESIQKKVVLYDKEGDYHFDTISAFIKSIRGSDVDAALYWLAKMLRAGEDADFIFRRLLISACEDIGLADPQAIVHTQACAQAFKQVGLPEGNFHLAQASIYLASAPKSNSNLAFFDALKEIEKADASVPSHLRDASRDGKAFGHGQGYLYPHAFKDHWVAQQYLPANLTGRIFWIPGDLGYEGKLKTDYLKRRELQIAQILTMDKEGQGDVLSWKEENKAAAHWYRRMDADISGGLLKIREAIFAKAKTKRHHSCLVLGAEDGLLVFQAQRSVPEGICIGQCSTKEGLENLAGIQQNLLQYSKEEELAHLLFHPDGPIGLQDALDSFGFKTFDIILAHEPLPHRLEHTDAWQSYLNEYFLPICKLLEKGASFVFSQSLPLLGQRLSKLSELQNFLDKEMLTAFKIAEQEYFDSADYFLKVSDLENISSLLSIKLEIEYIDNTVKRLAKNVDIENWFSLESSVWAQGLMAGLEKNAANKKRASDYFSNIKKAVSDMALKGPLHWERKILIVKAVKS